MGSAFRLPETHPKRLENLMNKLLTLSAALLVAAAGAANGQQSGQPAQKPAAPAPAPAQPSPAPSGKPEALVDKASYVIGVNLGKSLKNNDVQANVDLIVKGIRDGLG